MGKKTLTKKSQNAPKTTCSNVEIQKYFTGTTAPDPCFTGREMPPENKKGEREEKGRRGRKGLPKMEAVHLQKLFLSQRGLRLFNSRISRYINFLCMYLCMYVGERGGERENGDRPGHYFRLKSCTGNIAD